MDNYEKTKTKIQESIIQFIQEQVETDTNFIRFWTPEERIEDSEILRLYPTIYSVELKYEYPKASKIPVVRNFILKDFRPFDTSNPICLVLLELDPDILSKLRIWSKQAARAIHKYFEEEELYFLNGVRFDFLPVDKAKTSFVIPNLPLENIKFSKKRRGQAISTESYVNSKTITQEHLQSLESSFKKSSS